MLNFYKIILDTNKYITFEFRNWDNKHPMGVITQTLGDVTQLTSFYEYQLYCKSLYASIQDFTKATLNKLKERSELEFVESIIEKYNPEDYIKVTDIADVL